MAGVSVILPTYNQAPYLAAALQSVLSQTYRDVEVVVVVDGATDGTAGVLARFDDPRLRVIHQANAGLAAARNTGLRHASAPLVTFLDSDDLFEREKLARLTGELAARPEVDLVCGRTAFMAADGTVLDQGSGPPAPAALELPGLLLGNPLSVGAVLLRRRALDRSGWFDETLRACEDWDLWLRLAAAGGRLAWVDQVVLRYRAHTAQMTRDAGRMRAAMLAVLGNFFARPDLPPEWVQWRDPAVAAALVRAAARAYRAGDAEAAGRDLVTAVRLDPTWAADDYAPLVGQLVGWARVPGTDEAEAAAYLSGVRRHLPAPLAGLDRPLGRAIAALLLAAVFDGRAGDRAAVRRTIWRAWRSDPRWLGNRGLWRILVGTPAAPPGKARA
jgi:glycosyltransferase involved in cell wall biosynthesis